MKNFRFSQWRVHSRRCFKATGSCQVVFGVMPSRNLFEDDCQGVNAGILHCPLLSHYRKGLPPRLATGNRDFEIRGPRRQRILRLKMNSRSFSLYLDYFYPLTLSNELSWGWITYSRHIQVQKEKDNFILACLCPPHYPFLRRSRAVTSKKFTKRVCCTCKFVVLLIKPIAFIDVLVTVSVAGSERYLIIIAHR